MNKIPIVVGVTGHRDLFEEDKNAIREKVRESLLEIKTLCAAKSKKGEETPVIMLNAFAESADMLCAEVAFSLGIDVYAVLPRPEEEYIKSFENEEDRAKLHGYLKKTKRQLVAPDTEQNREWLNIKDSSYEYRQLGIYMAEHSHILLALWDGSLPVSPHGCGTAEVIQFALEHKFLDKDRLFRPGTINESAVVWIKCRRHKTWEEGQDKTIRKSWLISNLANKKSQEDNSFISSDDPPEFLEEIISRTAEYNNESFSIADDKVKLWENVNELDEYRKMLRFHYAKADDISYGRNQKIYNAFLLAIAILGTLVALTFMIYDDASLPYMIFPCSVLLGAILLLCMCGRKRRFQRKYILYRAFAEALRIQFYLTLCLDEKEILTNVCDLYSWTQKTGMVWAEKAIRAIAVIYPTGEHEIHTDDVISVWIGRNEKPEGQLHYHSRKKSFNRKKATLYENLSDVFRNLTIALYAAILLLEIITCICNACGVPCFWDGVIFGTLSCRNFGSIILGIFTAGSLLLSSYFGKLSYERKADDNEKMVTLYASACERWEQVKTHPKELKKFVTDIAREEIVENGIWCSYVSENRLEVNI